MDSNNFFEKLANLAADIPPGADPAAGMVPPEGMMPPAEAMTRQDAIDEAAHEASVVANEAVGDGAPPATVPDVPLEAASPETAPVEGPVPGDVPMDVPVDMMSEDVPAEEPLDAEPTDEEVLRSLVLERERLASYVDTNLVGFGTLARLYEAGTDESIDEAHQKAASAYLDGMLEDEQAFTEGLDKMAAELFADEADVDHLFTDAGIDYVLERVASFADAPFEKTADEGDGMLGRVRGAANGFVDNVKRLKNINSEIASLQSRIDEAKDMSSQLPSSGASVDEIAEAARHLLDLKGQKQQAQSFQAKGYGLAGLGAGALAGGAYLAGRQLADRNQGEVDVVAPDNGATLNTGNPPTLSENGGNYQMKLATTNENVYLDNMLKLAGAFLLIDGSENPAYGEEFNKLASDTFDEIAAMNRLDMETAFAKVALENYSDEKLREIVAGHHTDEILEKTAAVAAWDDLSADELVKIAGAGSVSAKGAAGALRDASEKVKNEIAQAKAQAEAEGREYVGDTDKAGKVGGGLVGGMEGYNVINNPGAYEVSKTAQEDIEAAVLLKQAAYDSYMEADAFLKATLGQ